MMETQRGSCVDSYRCHQQGCIWHLFWRIPMINCPLLDTVTRSSTRTITRVMAWWKTTTGFQHCHSFSNHTSQNDTSCTGPGMKNKLQIYFLRALLPAMFGYINHRRVCYPVNVNAKMIRVKSHDALLSNMRWQWWIEGKRYNMSKQNSFKR